MPAFVLATIDIHDEPTYMERYVPRAVATILDHGGTVLGVEHSEILEGTRFSPRNVIVGFPDMGALLGWYRSNEYQEARRVRHATSTGSLIAVEGTGEAFTPGSGYIVATSVLVDEESSRAKYAPTALATIAQHRGKVLARGGASEILEGDAFGSRSVIIEFPDLDAGIGWYRSPEYQAVVPVRQAASKDSSMVAIGGVPA